MLIYNCGMNPDESLRKSIASEYDLEFLNNLMDAAFEVESLEEFVEKMKQQIKSIQQKEYILLLEYRNIKSTPIQEEFTEKAKEFYISNKKRKATLFLPCVLLISHISYDIILKITIR